MEKCGTRLPSGIGARTAIMEHIQNDLLNIDNVDFGLSMYADYHQIYVKGKDMYGSRETSRVATGNYLVRFESSSGKPEEISDDEHSEQKCELW